MRFCSTCLAPRRVIELVEAAERRRAVVVDEDVEAPEVTDGVGNDALAILRLCECPRESRTRRP
jgi:hypothetical protein